MRKRLQSIYRIEDSACSKFEDLLKRLDEASAGRQENRQSN